MVIAVHMGKGPLESQSWLNTRQRVAKDGPLAIVAQDKTANMPAMSSDVPLLSAYKKDFVYRRLSQTLLGGIRLNLCCRGNR